MPSLPNSRKSQLTAAELAHPYSPSHSLLPISFVGLEAGGVTVTNRFTTPIGGTTNFTTFQFGADFVSGRARVKIPSSVWAMDNLVFGNVVPEPTSSTLALLAWLLFGAREAHRRRRPGV